MTDRIHPDEHVIVRYVRGALPADERRIVEAHLADCSACWSVALGLQSALAADRRRTNVRFLTIAVPAAAAAAIVFMLASPPGGRIGAPVITTAAVDHGEPGSVVSTDWLGRHVGDPSVVVLHIDSDRPNTRGPRFASGHVRGARQVDFAAIFADRDGNELELPPMDSLRSLFESRGVSDSTHVILTGHPVAVARAYMTLNALGLTRVSLLDGGTTKWRAEGRAVDSGATAAVAARGRITLRPDPSVIADRDFVRGHIGKRGVAMIDTRTEGEYLGAASWKGVPSTGHIAGARQMDWQAYFKNDSDLALRPREELEALIAAQAAAGDTVIAYCYNGGRSSTTYVIARVLGHPSKLYDGSYQDWHQHHLPTVTAPTPLRTR